MEQVVGFRFVVDGGRDQPGEGTTGVEHLVEVLGGVDGGRFAARFQFVQVAFTPVGDLAECPQGQAGLLTELPECGAETRVDVPDASVSDAVMMLDLRNTNALLFKNSGTGAYNMVYRRGDGTIGWVEPQRGA